AEMGASFLCAKAGIDIQPVTENSAAYLQGLLGVLKKDKKFIFKCAAKAQQAVDYILNVKKI
ncbi:MAG: zincin-like metallopeptidase domain-containing protein, partial [Bacteroidota bacterium]